MTSYTLGISLNSLLFCEISNIEILGDASHTMKYPIGDFTHHEISDRGFSSDTLSTLNTAAQENCH